MAYNHTVADPCIAFRIVKMKAVCYNVSTRELYHSKWNLHIMCGFIRASIHAELVLIYMLLVYHTICGSTIP